MRDEIHLADGPRLPRRRRAEHARHLEARRASDGVPPRAATVGTLVGTSLGTLPGDRRRPTLRGGSIPHVPRRASEDVAVDAPVGEVRRRGVLRRHARGRRSAMHASTPMRRHGYWCIRRVTRSKEEPLGRVRVERHVGGRRRLAPRARHGDVKMERRFSPARVRRGIVDVHLRDGGLAGDAREGHHRRDVLRGVATRDARRVGSPGVRAASAAQNHRAGETKKTNATREYISYRVPVPGIPVVFPVVFPVVPVIPVVPVVPVNPYASRDEVPLRRGEVSVDGFETSSRRVGRFAGDARRGDSPRANGVFVAHVAKRARGEEHRR